MPLTAETQAILKLREGAPALHTLSAAEARAASAALRPQGEPEPVHHVSDMSIPGPDGEIPVRLYTVFSETPLPTIVYYHGGGWVIGDLDSHDAVCRALANRVGCAVVSVDYRLAPEHRYPAAAEDAYAAAQWVAQQSAAHAQSVGADTALVAVAGDSAGGNLAAVVAQMARDRGGPDLAAQVLIYPVTDCDFSTDSYRDNGRGDVGLSEDGMRWFWDCYLNSPDDGSQAYASPMRADDLSGLPRALTVTAEFDPLRDEGEAYAAQLQAAGVASTCTRYDGVIHGFVSAFQAVPEGSQALDQIAAELRDAFA